MYHAQTISTPPPPPPPPVAFVSTIRSAQTVGKSTDIYEFYGLHGFFFSEIDKHSGQIRSVDYNTCITTRSEHPGEENKDHENEHQQLRTSHRQ